MSEIRRAGGWARPPARNPRRCLSIGGTGVSESVWVLIADGHPLSRDGLAAPLHAGQGTELAGAVTTGTESASCCGG
jgi:hypothetical protein